MRFARAGRAAMAAVLLAAGGCDYWDNLVDNKTLTRADLEVKVVDAWTGNSLPDAVCRDSLRSLSGTTDEQGVFQIVAGNTGQYTFNCSHEWYYDGAAEFHLTKAGGHVVAKLARRGEPGNWYPGDFGTVAILLTKGQDVRFPVGLDWQVVPSDTTGRFRYEWTFLQAKNLDRGHWVDHVQLDPQAYAPHFRARVNDPGVQGGSDTVILKVYSMMAQKESGGYLVGSDTLPFVWVRNRKPTIRFISPGNSDSTGYLVGCANFQRRVYVLVDGEDSDGYCQSIHLWKKNAPSLGRVDTTVSCGEDAKFSQSYPLIRPDPNQPSRNRINGSLEYDNTLYVKITDDNGDTAQDKITFKTYTNSPPDGGVSIVNPTQGAAPYFIGDPVSFEVHAHDTDGGIQQVEVHWSRLSDGLVSSASWDFDWPPHNVETHKFPTVLKDTGTFISLGRAIDDCPDTAIYQGSTFQVRKDSPPLISITTHSPVAKAGDSLEVTFDLTVLDDDHIWGDSLTAVSVSWDTDTIVSDPNPASPYPKTKTYTHIFGPPRPLSGYNIEVHTQDAHFGGSKDTSFRVP